MGRRRILEVESVLTFNFVNPDGDLVPTKVSVNSWIKLQAEKHGGHAIDAKKHSSEGGYKARILKFRWKEGSSTAAKVLVQHVYMRRQLDLDPTMQHGGSNYLYLSNFEDWVDPRSIIDVLYVVHAEIGEAQRGNDTHKELLQIGVYFYSAKYFPRRTPTTYGTLEEIPLPPLNSLDWTLPNMCTTESFRATFRQDFRSSMKPTIGSRATHIQWFLPIHVMVDLFSSTTFHHTPTLLVFKNLDEGDFKSLMDDGWESKICVGADIIKCVVNRSTLIFRYHIGRSTLYTNFQYNRERLIHGSNWEPLEQVHADEVVKITCKINENGEALELEVGSKWSLASVRQEVIIALGYDAQEEFDMYIVQGNTREKVNARHERLRTVQDVLAPRLLQIVPDH